MYPMYRYMDPYSQAFPFSRDQIPYPYHHYPSWGPVPSHIEPSKHPSDFGPWLYNTSLGHSIPTENHNCCSHSYPPGLYAVRPPYPHIPPPPQLYCHGAYPLHPSASPAYSFSPPHYPADQAIYDYDKAKDHCCGCPNHICNQKDGSNGLKIDQKLEEEPKNNGSSSLFQSPNYPYPVVWIPPGYLKDNDKTKDSESRAGLGNGLIPLGMHSLTDKKGGGEEKKSQNGVDRKMQYPWPIFCLPGYEGKEDKIKEIKESNVDPKSAEELPMQFKSVPLKLLENENHAEKPEVATDESGGRVHQERMAERETNTKIIPVKQMEELPEKQKEQLRKKNTPEKENTEVKKASDRETKTKIIPVKQMEEPTEKVLERKKNTPEKENTEVKMASDSKPLLSKKSNLPPVCLRVDPLPRKKNTNGNSRSPSPPLHKEERPLQKNKEQEIAEGKEKATKKEIKVVDIGESKKPEVVPAVSIKVTEGQTIVEMVRDDDWKKAEGKVLERAVEKEELKVEKEGNVAASKSGGGEPKERRKLSESEAAVLVQSAYRRFEVRRWQPLEKLRKIAQIREQVADVKGQIDGLEASSKQQDAKQKVVISETIMNLLLQLDTVQGLHPSVREIRKAVAKDLTCLQEKLDSIGSHATGEDEPAKHEEDSTGVFSNDGSALVQNLSTATKLADEGEYAQPASENGELVQPPFQLETSSYLNNADVASGDGEVVETLEMNDVEMTSNNEEQREEPLVKEESLVCEVIEKPDTGNRTAKQSFEDEKVSTLDEAPVSDEKELPNSQEVNHGEFTMVQENVSEKNVSDAEAALDLNVDPDSEWHSKASLEEECNQEKKSSEWCSMVVIKPEEESVVAKPEEVPIPSDVDIDQQNHSETSLEELSKPSSEELNKPEEEDILVNSHELKPKSNTEGLVELSAEEEKSDTNTGIKSPLMSQETEMKREPLLVFPVVEENHVSDTLVLGVTGSPNSLEVSCGDAASKFIDSGASLESTNSEFSNLTSGGDGFAVSEANTTELKGGVAYEGAPTMELEDDNDVIVVHEKHDGMNSQLEDAGSEAIKFIETGEFSNLASCGVGLTVNNEANTTESKGRVAYDHLQESAHGVAPTMELNSIEKKLVEENEKLKEMLEKLLEAGKQQLGTISDLNGRVRDLEKKLSQKKNTVKAYVGNSVSPAA